MAIDLLNIWALGESIPSHPRVRISDVNGSKYVVRKVTDHRQFERYRVLETLLPDHVFYETGAEMFVMMPYFEGAPLSGARVAEHCVEHLVAKLLPFWMQEYVDHTDLPAARLEQLYVHKKSVEELQNTPLNVLEIDQLASLTVAKNYGYVQCQEECRLIHGDLKADNVIQIDGGNIQVIDWECSGRGYIEDDIATFLSSRLIFCISADLSKLLPEPEDSHLQNIEGRLREVVITAVGQTRKESQRFLSELRRYGISIDKYYLTKRFVETYVVRCQSLYWFPGSKTVQSLCLTVCRTLITAEPSDVREEVLGIES